MRRRLPFTGLGIAVALAGLVGGGCGSSGAQVSETRDGRITVQGDGDRQTATIQGDGSTVTYGTGTVPKGFPAAVPLPKGAELATTAAGARGDTRFFQLTYLPGTTAATALDAYGTRLTDSGFTVTGGAGASFDATDGTWKVRAVAGSGSEPTLAVTVTDA